MVWRRSRSRLDVAQGADLEDVGVVPALLERGVGEDELERGLEAEELLLLLHDQAVRVVIGLDPRLPLMFSTVLPPTPLLVDREVPFMDVFRGSGEVDLAEQRAVVREVGGPPVLLLEDQRQRPLHRVAVLVVAAVFGDLVDEEERKHLDALRAEALLLVEVLVDGATDHLALHRQCVDVAPRLAGLEEPLVSGDAQLDVCAAATGPDLADAAVGVERSPGGLLEVVTVKHRHLAAAYTGEGLQVHLDPGGDLAAAALRRDEAHVRLVVGVLHGGRRDLDLLHQALLVGVHGIEPVNHVVLVHVGGRVAQRAQWVHRVERLLPRPWRPPSTLWGSSTMTCQGTSTFPQLGDTQFPAPAPGVAHSWRR